MTRISLFIRAGGISQYKMFFYRVALKRSFSLGMKQVVLIDLETFRRQNPLGLTCPHPTPCYTIKKMRLASFVKRRLVYLKTFRIIRGLNESLFNVQCFFVLLFPTMLH